MTTPSKRYTGFFDYIGIGPSPLETLAAMRLAVPWSEIATDAEHDAKNARNRRDSNAELRAALVGVTAVAHALDAVYGELKDRVPQQVRDAWARNRAPRRNRILETMKFAAGTEHASWSAEFAWLFDERRDPALHPDSETRPLEAHPAGGHSSRERVRYTVEAITRALDLLVSVLDAVGGSTKMRESDTKWYQRLSATIAAERLVDARVSAAEVEQADVS